MRTLVLLKKEVMEIFRTSKIYVLPAVFLFIAITSPLMAKYMPTLINSILEYSGQQMQISIPTPTYIDAMVASFVMASVISKTYMMSAVISVLTFVGISMLGSIPVLDKYTPGYIITLGLDLFKTNLTFADYAWPIGTSLLILVASIIVALASFKRQEL